ncbi:DUF6527 family protein [uncultured Sphaerochaeta sp.]|uniref:DUF6527 family protein n=1 Tax=uncultured Sphaerochaeta sp. TaxID=886478 RepID=UPI00374A077C
MKISSSIFCRSFKYKFPSKYKIKFLPKTPSLRIIKKNLVYIIKNNDKYYWAILRCPCGCKNVISLSLSDSKDLYWTLSVTDYGYPTLTPSIKQIKGCYSHFYLKNGDIVWC